MNIRPLDADDFSETAQLLIQTFHPFFEDYVQNLLEERIFLHQHGSWEQDYRNLLPTLHAPESGRYAAVATTITGDIVGVIAWRLVEKPGHGEIYLVAVSPSYRRQQIGRDLCEHAMAAMRTADIEVVEVSTGGDPFHASARALYQRLGFTPIPIVAYLKAL